MTEQPVNAVAAPSAVTSPNPNPNTASNPASADSEDKSVYTYIFIAILAVCLMLLLYFAYGRFVSGSVEESMTKGAEHERDDPVIDFNLREAIRELQNMQKQVLATLSDSTDF